MAKALNGIHFQSPADGTAARTQVLGASSGVGFGSVLILSHAGVPPVGEALIKDNIYWLEYKMACRPASVAFHEALVVRLYYPAGADTPLPSASDLAAMWGPMIRWCQGQGVYNFQVLNELDIEHNGNVSGQYMAELANFILNRERDQSRNCWLGFPGPSAAVGMYPGTPNWNNYWNRYAGAIGSYYSWLAPHAYPGPDSGSIGLTGLKNHTYAQATNLRSRFPDRPQRFTEYGIPLDHYATGDRTLRASDYVAYMKWVRSGWNDYILACHVFVAFDSRDDSNGQGWERLYELSDNEVKVLTQAIGCVGQ